MAIIDYDLEKVYTKSLEVDDPGNCCIRATNPDYEDYYISFQSIMGSTYILKFGPVVPDLEAGELEKFSLDYKKIKYSMKSINIEITKFINDPMKRITEAEIVDQSLALAAIPGADAYIAA